MGLVGCGETHDEWREPNNLEGWLNRWMVEESLRNAVWFSGDRLDFALFGKRVEACLTYPGTQG